MVFDFPPLSAGTITPFEAAISRIPVTTNSRQSVIRASGTLIWCAGLPTKPMTRPITMILSAKASISLPKFVIRPRLRAM